MKLKIEHTTEYNYDSPVFFEPHYLRFKPKDTPHSTLIDFKLKIDPEPSGFSEQIDIENNHIALCWFENTHKSLKLSIESIIEVHEYNPFNFLIHPSEYLELPFRYNNQTEQLLKPSLDYLHLNDGLKGFSDDLLKKNKHETTPFLLELTKEIHKQFIIENRELGEPHDPNISYQLKRGSCRDLTWMQIHLLRQSGIAARFVSGYFYLHSENPQFELHAWVEAFLPGAGWVGFDPSNGIVCGHFHIPLASSAFYENTMPVSGSTRGESEANLQTDLNISIVTT